MLHYELIHCHTQEHFIPLAAVRKVKEIIRHWEKNVEERHFSFYLLVARPFLTGAGRDPKEKSATDWWPTLSETSSYLAPERWRLAPSKVFETAGGHKCPCVPFYLNPFLKVREKSRGKVRS